MGKPVRIGTQYAMYLVNIMYLASIMYPVITIGGVMYLKGPQSLPRQFLPCSESQNIIRVNLLGTYSTINTSLKRVYLYYLA